MELRRFRYFIAVAEAGSLGKAAQRLGMAQPPLSIQIRKLEQDLGVVLFRRIAQGMDMTDAGRVFLPRAKEAVALAEDAAVAARAVASGRQGRLSIGYMLVMACTILPRLVPLLRKAMPDITLDLVELTAASRERAILERDVTVALCMPMLHHADIEGTILRSERLMLVLPRRAPLARHLAIAVAKLQGQKLISLPKQRDSAPATTVATLLRQHGVTMPIVQHVETVPSALGLVLAGEGYAILPESAALYCPQGVVFRPFLDAPASMEIAACWRRDMRNPLLDRFLHIAQQSTEQGGRRRHLRS
jgi:DNA-binding transcriptional LysR family regulator